MKNRSLLATFALVVMALSAKGQGTIQFANHVTGVVDAPVFALDGTNRLDGPAYSAQLYAGPSADTLSPVSELAPFRADAAAGYFQMRDPAIEIPTVAPGSMAFCQVRVWESAKSTNYDAALDAGSAHGESETI